MFGVGVRGVVIDTLTKKPVAGAMVYLDRDPPPPPGSVGNFPQQDSGRETRTDGSGRFRFSGVDLNTHYIAITKAGYTSSSTEDLRDYHTYQIQTDPHMGDLRFFLTPTAEITGRVSSDKEQSVSGMQLTLYKELIDDGRGAWQKHGEQLSDAHGAYSFTGLKAGTYVVVSSWLVDNDPGSPGRSCSSYQLDPQSGYAPEANPGVPDFSAAQPIVLAQGQRATTDLKLQHQIFYTVTLPPGRGPFRLLDRNGRELMRDPPPGSQCGWAFPGKIDWTNGRLQTINLPDGTYTMPIHDGDVIPQGRGKPMKLLLANFTTFTVAGSPLTVPNKPAHLLPAPATQIHAHYELTSHPCDAPQIDPTPNRPAIWLSSADPLPEKALGMGEMNRTNDSNLAEFTYLASGRYWVHADELNLQRYEANTYVASITAGGVDMLREPLVVGPDGTSPPLEVTLRNDCGTLRVKYSPANPYQGLVGLAEPFYGVLVPQFSGWVNSREFMFEDNTPWLSIIRNLPPGHYKFYVTRRKMRGIEFRDPTKITADFGPGQDIRLEAGGKAEVSVTEPLPE